MQNLITFPTQFTRLYRHTYRSSSNLVRYDHNDNFQNSKHGKKTLEALSSNVAIFILGKFKNIQAR